MTTFTIKPSTLQGSIAIPPSKSHTLRAILFALMAQGKSIIRHYLISPDTEAMVRAVQALGAQVTRFPDRIEIVGTGGNLNTPREKIDAGNSGQVLRFIAAFAALISNPVVMTGDFSIRNRRPIRPLLQALEQLGALTGENPCTVQGPVVGSHAQLNGEDSQPVSALLMMGAFMTHNISLQVTNPGEKPWIDLTLFWLKKMGCRVVHKNYEHYEIYGGISYPGFDVTIPGDWSSAAYPLVAALVTGSEITLTNLDGEDVQGDKRLVEILEEMGALIEKIPHGLKVKKSPSLQGVQVNLNDCIDMVTILPIVACFAKTPTEITGVKIARFKESDRLQAITQELKKMGGEIEEREEGMVIFPSTLKGTTLESHADHRMTLALSVAGLAAKGESVIKGAEAIDKSYSTFKEDMIKLGAAIH